MKAFRKLIMKSVIASRREDRMAKEEIKIRIKEWITCYTC